MRWISVPSRGKSASHLLNTMEMGDKQLLQWATRLWKGFSLAQRVLHAAIIVQLVLNPFSASQLSTTNFSLYNTYKIWHLVMRNENWSNKANYWRLKVKFSQICSMKSMDSGWENLKIQLALKGLREDEVREWIPDIGLTPRVNPLRLFLDMVPSSSADVISPFRVCFRGIEVDKRGWSTFFLLTIVLNGKLHEKQPRITSFWMYSNLNFKYLRHDLHWEIIHI